MDEVLAKVVGCLHYGKAAGRDAAAPPTRGWCSSAASRRAAIIAYHLELLRRAGRDARRRLVLLGDDASAQSLTQKILGGRVAAAPAYGDGDPQLTHLSVFNSTTSSAR
jgi:hypothetical protein